MDIELPNPGKYPKQISHDLKNAYFKHIGYEPHPGQRSFHDSSARMKILVAGARFGKSLAAAREVEPYILASNTRGWIVGPTYDLGSREFQYIFQSLIDDQQIETNRKSFSDRSMIIETTWNSFVEVRSAHNPISLLGEELDWLILSEAAQLSQTVYERFLRARLSTRIGKLIVPSTPNGFGWLYDMFIRGQDPDFPDFESWQFPTWANPLVAPEEIEAARKELLPHIFDEQYGGHFTKPAGLVYPEFQESIHVREEPEEEFCERYRAIDPGYRNPFAVVMVGRNFDGRYHVFAEYYQRERTTEDHIEFLRDAGRFDLTVIDPSAAQLIRDLRTAGITAIPGANDIQPGIDMIRSYLAIGPDGLPGLTVHPRCRHLINEFREYRYPSDFENPRLAELPLKENDHALDALRYLLMTLHQRGKL
ncbi:MAG: hypothetical protein NUW37_04425 [Planctomycetes bacterium]|nr:hypothetical protein [Planctomycetota bacterium]